MLFSRKTFVFSLKATVSVVLVGFLVVKIDWARVWEQLSAMSLFWLLAYVAAVAAGIFISALKWKILAQSAGFRQPFRKFLLWYYTGTFLNNFFPGFVGGDTYRVLRLAGAKKKFARAAATVLADRFSGFWVFAVLGAVFALFAYFSSGQHVYLSAAFFTFSGAILTVFLYLFRSRILEVKFLPRSLRKFLSLFEIYSWRNLRKPLIVSTVFALIGVALANYLLFLALGEFLDPLLYAAFVFFISIIIAVPITINNFGTKEWAYITFFGLLGISEETAVAAVLAGRVLQMLVSLPAVFWLWRKKKIVRAKN